MDMSTKFKRIIFDGNSMYRVVVDLILDENGWRVLTSSQGKYYKGEYVHKGINFYTTHDMELFEKRAISLCVEPAVASVSVTTHHATIKDGEVFMEQTILPLGKDEKLTPFDI